MEGENGWKKIRFQKYSDTCGRSLTSYSINTIRLLLDYKHALRASEPMVFTSFSPASRHASSQCSFRFRAHVESGLTVFEVWQLAITLSRHHAIAPSRHHTITPSHYHAMIVEDRHHDCCVRGIAESCCIWQPQNAFIGCQSLLYATTDLHVRMFACLNAAGPKKHWT